MYNQILLLHRLVTFARNKKRLVMNFLHSFQIICIAMRKYKKFQANFCTTGN